MRTVKIKKDSEFVIPGVDIVIDRMDGDIKSVKFYVGGKFCGEINKVDYYSMTIAIPEQPKIETKYKVVGKVKGFPISLVYDDRSDAERNLEEVDEGTIEEVQVEVER